MNPSGDVEVSKPQAFHTSNGTFGGQDKLPGDMMPNYMPQTDFEVFKAPFMSYTY